MLFLGWQSAVPMRRSYTRRDSGMPSAKEYQLRAWSTPYERIIRQEIQDVLTSWDKRSRSQGAIIVARRGVGDI